MAGIYIHIPFCKKACTYCDFHFSTQLSNKGSMVASIADEINKRSSLITERIETIYFGGGTPSLLSPKEFDRILNSLHKNFNISSNPELTLELNPDDMNEEKIKSFQASGLNRLSIGIQSFDDDVLKFMNRSHSAQESVRIVEIVQKLGLENITADLIYGIPNRDLDYWKTQLEKAVALNIPHISSYALTVEPKTALAFQVEKKQILMPDDFETEAQFFMLNSVLDKAGYDHYELSNFAKDGFQSRHNSSYWNRVQYIGFGPSAHSFIGKERSWNVSHNLKYMKAMDQNLKFSDSEVLEEKDYFNETIMTSLRLKKGIDLEKIETEFSEPFLGYLRKESKELLSQGRLVQEGSFLKIPLKFRFQSDGIAAELFYI